MGWEGVRAAAGDLLLGARCPGCDTPGWGVCRRCRADLAGRRPYVTAPEPVPEDFPLTVTSSSYDPVLRRMISAHKERQALGLAGLLGERLALSVQGLLRRAGTPAGAAVVLVPVPSAGRAVRERGYDATGTLARLAARRLATQRPVRMVAALAQQRGVQDQAGLDAHARRLNLQDAYRLRRRPEGLVVVVDDVVTTGSSLAEAVRTLERSGVEVLGAATVAATVRRHPARPAGPVTSAD